MGSGDEVEVEEEEEEEEEEETQIDLEHADDYEDYNDGMFHFSSGAHNFNGGDPNIEPYEGMEFDSEQAARIFYNS